MELNIGMARMMISMTWTNQATLMCTWVGFFSVALFVFWNKKKPKKIENETARQHLVHFRDLPSPLAFPVVGNMLQLSSQPHLELTEWAKKYGPLFRIKMGFKEVLVVTGLDHIKTALVKKSTSFAGRPDLETSKLVCQGLSLTFSDYSRSWEHQKMAAKAAVSCYTSGKDPTKRTVMENNSVKHANSLVNQLIETAKEQKGIVDPRDIVLANSSNAVCKICFGQDFDIKDKKLKELLSINRNFDEAMGAAQPVNFWPILRHCPMIARSFKKLEVYFEKFWSFLSELLETHWETYDDNNLRDLTDCLYHESEKERSNNNEKISKTTVLENGSLSNGTAHTNGVNGIHNHSHEDPYTSHHKSDSLIKPHTIEDYISESEIRRRIMYSTGDIFGAGYDTMFTTLHWSLLYMAAYPNAQTKMWKEINRAVAPEESFSFRLHGFKCAYTLAWIYEVLRHSSLSPLLVPHATTEATELDNCFIPKGTMVYFNSWQANKDPEVWDDPEDFNPERFLIEKNGTYSMKPNASSKLIVWGAGKRKCLGHELSKHLLFIFITTIVRRINVQQSKPGVEPALPWPSNFGLTLKPKNFKICITERQDI